MRRNYTDSDDANGRTRLPDDLTPEDRQAFDETYGEWCADRERERDEAEPEMPDLDTLAETDCSELLKAYRAKRTA